MCGLIDHNFICCKMSYCVGILLGVSFGSIWFYPSFSWCLCNDWNFIFLSLSLVCCW